MKFVIFFIIVLSYALIIESLSDGLAFLSCPNGDGLINCNKVKCCPSAKTICCLEKSSVKTAIPLACGSIYPKGHPLGCCGQKLCSEK